MMNIEESTISNDQTYCLLGKPQEKSTCLRHMALQLWMDRSIFFLTFAYEQT